MNTSLSLPCADTPATIRLVATDPAETGEKHYTSPVALVDVFLGHQSIYSFLPATPTTFHRSSSSKPTT